MISSLAGWIWGCIADGGRDHHMSGPFHVPGAQPGDVLEIDILESVEPYRDNL